MMMTTATKEAKMTARLKMGAGRRQPSTCQLAFGGESLLAVIVYLYVYL